MAYECGVRLDYSRLINYLVSGCNDGMSRINQVYNIKARLSGVTVGITKCRSFYILERFRPQPVTKCMAPMDASHNQKTHCDCGVILPFNVQFSRNVNPLESSSTSVKCSTRGVFSPKGVSQSHFGSLIQPYGSCISHGTTFHRRWLLAAPLSHFPRGNQS